jgi:uncharacterized membrane protein YfcA
MEITAIIAYILALLVGISLGLMGSGGSILTVPILVYVLGIDAVTATGYSLFIVGFTALAGGLRSIRSKNVAFDMVAVFGLPSMVSAYITRAFIIPALPDPVINTGNWTLSKSVFLLILFAFVMLTAALKMIKPKPVTTDSHPSNIRLVISGLGVGILAGAVGAGGGFLIIPALVLMARLPMQKAVGTSLMIIAIQSLAGFFGATSNTQPDWNLLLTFTLASVVGIVIGLRMARQISGEKLKKGFGWFVLAMGLYILIREVYALG